MSAIASGKSPMIKAAHTPGARKLAFPSYIEPADPSLREHSPRGDEWVYEIKIDGYRAQLHRRCSKVTVYSRTGLDWTKQFSRIAAAAAFLKQDAVIDGEVVVFGATGLPDFQALRRELGANKGERLRYHAFDLLYLDRYDLRNVVYAERKRLLGQLLKNAPEAFVYVDYIQADGETVFRKACQMGLEGVVAKRRDAPYRSGRLDTWIKLKCIKSDTYPIVAFVEKLGAKPRKIASLYVGKREDGKLVYAGKVRSGYTESVAREVRERLDPLIVKKSPLAIPVVKPKATWVRPVIDAEVQYSGITDDGLLRAATFKGFRDDLARPKIGATFSAWKPRRSQEKPHIGVPRANILQLLPDAVVPSKEQLARYWKKVGKQALLHLGRRPLKLVRHVHGTTFYHKGPLPPDIAQPVHQLRIEKREGGEGTRLWVDSVEGLLSLVAIGAVELHPWNATVADVEHADRIVIDLDPGEGVAWDAIVEAALRMRDVMRTDGLTAWPKLTGGKGLHLMTPLRQPLPHDEAHRRAHRLVRALAARHPALYILSAQEDRRGRIFLDYLRNGRGTTAIGTYSPRAREGFPIAAPINWRRLQSGIRPDAFTMKSPFHARTPESNRPVRKRQ